MAEYKPSPVGLDDNGRLERPFDEAPAAEGPREEEAPDRRVLQRRRPRARQLQQRGFWVDVGRDARALERRLGLHTAMKEGTVGVKSIWGWRLRRRMPMSRPPILCSSSSRARRMKKPQPRSGPGEVPLRKSLLLLEDGAGLSTDWESRYTVSPSFQVRFLALGRKLYLVLFGRQSGEGVGEGDADPWHGREQARERQWQAPPRELKLAIKRCT